jgi:hypothetical protein
MNWWRLALISGTQTLQMKADERRYSKATEFPPWLNPDC